MDDKSMDVIFLPYVSSQNAANGPPVESSGAIGALSATNEEDEVVADWHTEDWKLHKQHVFILSFAGKPIYSRLVIEIFVSSFGT